MVEPMATTDPEPIVKPDWLPSEREILLEILAGVGAVLGLLKQIIWTEGRTMALMDDVEGRLVTLENAEQGIMTLCGALKADLDAAGTDPTRLAAIRDKLGNDAAAIAAAIVANTPADPNAGGGTGGGQDTTTGGGGGPTPQARR